jgi:hemerythrin
MDDQHGVLLDALNDLRKGLAKGEGPETARKLIGRLIELTRLHFASEEQLLGRFDYPGLAAHHAEHQHMLGRLAEYAGWLQSRPAGANTEVAQSLRGWFLTHIEGCDQLYGPWLRERGVR